MSTPANAVSGQNSAELAFDKPSDPTTGLPRELSSLGLHEHSNERLGARRADEDAPCVAQLGVDALDRLAHRRGQALRRHAHVLLALREPLQNARRLAEGAVPERAAQEQRG